MRTRLIVALAAGLLVAGGAVRAQYYQTDFPADEFRSRHARVFDAIGQAAVVVQGVPQTEGFTLPRQHKHLLLPLRHRNLEKGIVQKAPPVAASAIRRGTR